MTPLVFGLSVALGIGVLLGSPAAVFAVDLCGTTLGPGAKVVLDMDQSCNSDPAFTVVGPVSLDLNGFTVACASTLQAGIVIEGTGAKLINGVVTGCRTGVALEGSKHTVEEIVAHAIDGRGFSNNAPNSRFTHNAAIGNDGSGFDNRPAAEKSRYSGNTATANVQFGFANGGAGSSFSGNVATGNGFGGFVNGFTGIGNISNTFSKNTAAGNQGDGFRNISNDNKFSGNTAVGNEGDGIANWIQARRNTFKGNVALGNGGNDLVDRNADCDDNSWKNKLFGTSDSAGVSDPDCIQ